MKPVWLGLVIALLPGMAHCECHIAEILQDIRPGAEWNLSGNSYKGLEWLDSRQSRPSEEEINAGCIVSKPLKLSVEEKVLSLEDRVKKLEDVKK